MALINVENKSRGSLFLGKLDQKPEVGTKVRVNGEAKVLTATGVMGSEKKGWHLTFRDQGQLPIGPVSVELLPE